MPYDYVDKYTDIMYNREIERIERRKESSYILYKDSQYR